ncbi:hypothetical protein [Hirschia litorea]|uniref:Uncharacterized protein n=1 Tax=Hirschia litorea TaxID=1199156 RepID=A0ABW2IKN7_9PROT
MSEMSEPRSKEKETGISLTGAARYREANFECWAKRAFWLPEEIAALSLEKDPSSLNESSVGEVALSNIGLEFLEISETVRRAVLGKQIPEKCQPDVAIHWMKKFDLKVPEALEIHVSYFYPSFDWKEAFLNFHKQVVLNYDIFLDELGIEREPAELFGVERLENLSQQIVDKIKDIPNQGEQIEEHAKLDAIDQYNCVANDNINPDDNTKVFQSRDKLLVGMFISKYHYDINAKKQKAFVKVVDDLQRCGISLTYETSKQHLLEAIDRVRPPLSDDN